MMLLFESRSFSLESTPGVEHKISGRKLRYEEGFALEAGGVHGRYSKYPFTSTMTWSGPVPSFRRVKVPQATLELKPERRERKLFARVRPVA